MRALIVLLALALGGCAVTIPIGDRPTVRTSAPELVWQAVNGADMATTINGARCPQYAESGWPTANIIGSHPTERSVKAYWAAEATLHWAVSSWLDQEASATDSPAWRLVRGAWYAVTIADAAYSFNNNYQLGLRPFGGCHP